MADQWTQETVKTNNTFYMKNNVVIDAETAISPNKDRKPPTHGMKWIKLGEGKDPEFKTTYILYRWPNDNQLPYYTTGVLKSKTEGETHIAYSFFDEKVGETNETFTHYCHPKPPVD